jgi:putative spermidine/putrescine transport system substrate-binding protein
VAEKLNQSMSRRDLLKAGGVVAGAAIAGPLVAACTSAAATAAPTAAPATQGPSGAAPSVAPTVRKSAAPPSVLVVMDAGGSYGAANKAAIYDPFTKETGVPIATVTMPVAQFLAQATTGNVEISCIETAVMAMLNMQNAGALQPLDYTIVGTSFDMKDIPSSLKLEYQIGKLYWATCMTYRTDVFTEANHPKSWAEFWDTAKFPGPRAMQDNVTDRPELEFALLADGVAMDKLYPLDIDRALASMTKIRKSIVKFWTSGAESANLLDTKEVVLESVWSGRSQALIDAGKPVANEWSQARRQINGYCVPKNSPHPEWAMRLIDFALRPGPQAAVAEALGYGAVNKSGAALVSAAGNKKSPSNPAWVDKGFDMNVQWWLDNLKKATDAWTEWYQKG